MYIYNVHITCTSYTSQRAFVMCIIIIHITLRCTRIGLMFGGGNRLFERTKRRATRAAGDCHGLISSERRTRPLLCYPCALSSCGCTSGVWRIMLTRPQHDDKRRNDINIYKLGLCILVAVKHCMRIEGRFPVIACYHIIRRGRPSKQDLSTKQCITFI